MRTSCFRIGDWARVNHAAQGLRSGECIRVVAVEESPRVSGTFISYQVERPATGERKWIADAHLILGALTPRSAAALDTRRAARNLECPYCDRNHNPRMLCEEAQDE